MGPQNEVVISREAPVKQVSWVDRVYQKLEAMCVEVDKNPSLLYQETTKYVENQMNMVGKNVRKICAELIQDLLPPSTLPAELPVKRPDSSGQHCCDIVASEKLQEKTTNVSLEIVEDGIKDSFKATLDEGSLATAHSSRSDDNAGHLEDRTGKEIQEAIRGCVEQRSSHSVVQQPVSYNEQTAEENFYEKRIRTDFIDASCAGGELCHTKGKDLAAVTVASLQHQDDDEEQSAHWLINEEDGRVLKLKTSASFATLDFFDGDPKVLGSLEDFESDWEFI